MFSLHFKRLWKNKVTLCMAIFILLMRIVLMYVIGVDEVMKIDHAYSMATIGMITIIPYLFFVFLFLSYEIFYRWNKSADSGKHCRR